ncbi:D-alanyl-D-alanine carboxypeptidase [Collimonas arenae]|uniref:D-alanyl-D-alanine carboxypeptidase n=1 Tax=Collimonas arenae TaxID=279058 RepID=A0A0A1FI65_9BURK|nr:D-alanyl-D-alanine carboxypeptidase/D-alanyl-D-alanine-endopeptidase [Collimonas arenae]AIY43400.1 D-alanyl-D-alanine carboxypeptidase [Collimonas arenae]
MKKIFAISLLVSSSFLLVSVQAQESSSSVPAPFSKALQIAGIPAQGVGVYVQEVDGTGKVLASSNAAVPFNPASTMKLVTTDAALELLGPAYRWKTQAYADGSQVGNVLQGDLIFKGNGDPKLVQENFWLFLRQIRAKGIRDIRGNIVLDRSSFDETAYDPSEFDGDPMKPYNVGPDALLLNYKALTFQFVPDPDKRQVSVVLDPPMSGYPVKPPRLGQGSCDDWQGKLQASVDADGASFNGVLPASCGEKTWYVNPYKMNSTQYFGAVFRQMWTDLGGTFSGSVKNGSTPPGARLITEWSSVTLPEVIRDINKYSNNVMARQVLLTIAADILKLPATPERGARAIQTWLANKGIDASGLVIENGSGLSRNEKISAQTMGRMMAAAFQSPVMPEFVSSMPLVGYDGTMRKRLKDQSVAGQAHVKTGTLNDVRAIAGYVLAASGKYYAVVCLINHPNAGRGQAAQDVLLQWVYENG